MAAPTKTLQTDLVAWQDIASAAQVISPAFDCSTKFAGAVGIHLGRLNGTAFTLGWPKVRIEVSDTASDNSGWAEIDQFQMAIGASIANTTLNGALTAGGTTAVVTSATNFVVGDLVFIGDSSTANYELCKIKSISGTTLTFEEAYTFNHANGSVITSQAERYFPLYDLSGYKRIRAIVDNANSGQGIKARVSLTTEDTVA